MDANNSAYLLIESAALVGTILISYSTGVLKSMLTRRFLLLTAGLYGLWLSIDLVAVANGIYFFPERGSLPIRILGLPLEEHLFFPIHTAIVWMLLSIARRDSASP